MSVRKKRSPPPPFATSKGTWERNPYTLLFQDQLDSPAYIGLSASAKEAYTILREEYKGPIFGSTVICPYSTFQKKGMRPNTLSRALLMLETFGFIKIDHGGLEHQPNRYTFSEAWKDIKTDEDVRTVQERLNEAIARKNRAKSVLMST